MLFPCSIAIQSNYVYNKPYQPNVKMIASIWKYELYATVTPWIHFIYTHSDAPIAVYF